MHATVGRSLALSSKENGGPRTYGGGGEDGKNERVVGQTETRRDLSTGEGGRRTKEERRRVDAKESANSQQVVVEGWTGSWMKSATRDVRGPDAIEKEEAPALNAGERRRRSTVEGGALLVGASHHSQPSSSIVMRSSTEYAPAPVAVQTGVRSASALAVDGAASWVLRQAVIDLTRRSSSARKQRRPSAAAKECDGDDCTQQPARPRQPHSRNR